MRPSACLLLPVSWLFVVFIPGLLMLAAFGLERLEDRLGQSSVGAAEVDEFLALADPTDVTRLARDGMSEALESCQRRRMSRLGPVRELAGYSRAFPPYVHPRPIPQFRQTRHADSV
jgi:hypothetical protein